MIGSPPRKVSPGQQFTGKNPPARAAAGRGIFWEWDEKRPKSVAME